MICRNCGSVINEGDAFCTNCGMRVEAPPRRPMPSDHTMSSDQTMPYEEPMPYEQPEPYGQPVPPTPPNKGNKTVLIVIIVAAVVVAGAIAAFALLSKDKEPEEPADKTPPTIIVKHDSIDEGEPFDIEYFVSVEDDVDGPINKSDINVDGEVDTDVPGKYDVTVTASDVSGNEASESFTIEVIRKQGDKAAFIKKIAGLWLNGCQSAADAKATAKAVGETDNSMTEFIQSGDQCIMTTIGDITGEFDGDTVPDVKNGVIDFSYVSSDLKKAKGTVDGMEITFDLGSPDDQVIYYSCGGYYTHCAYTGFLTERAMIKYLEDQYD